MVKKEKQIFSKGLTLIELIVALSIFALIVPLAVNLLVSIVQDQRKLLTQQDLLNQGNYLAEYMSRALRTAIKADGTSCLSQTDRNYEIANGCSGGGTFGGSGTGIKFINHTDSDSCQVFCLNQAGGYLQEVKNYTGLPSVTSKLTPGNYKVKSFNVFVSPDPAANSTDKYQSRVTFDIDLQACDPNSTIEACQASNPPEVQVQTTVSQRNLNL